MAIFCHITNAQVDSCASPGIDFPLERVSFHSAVLLALTAPDLASMLFSAVSVGTYILPGVSAPFAEYIQQRPIKE